MMNLISTIHALDSLVAHFFLSLRTPLLTQVFELITMLGTPITTTVITIIVAAIIYKKHHTYIIPLLTTAIGAGITIYATKIFFHRLRPRDALITEKSFSFPSGHALISMALYGLITYIIYRNYKKKSQKITTISIGTLLIFLIGISRLYLGVHYFSDVIGGYLIGSIWLAIGIALI
ncbi:MAG: phosphatase PAP2 family protein [Candidatus Peregrinibacteria bacterium]|nr:phosphatase PAP2 family protein [Candidatus Peregrinibacteria bacterium]